MGDKTKTEETPDAQAQYEAEVGELDTELREAGVSEIEIKEFSPLQKLHHLKKLAAEKAEREAEGKKDSVKDDEVKALALAVYEEKEKERLEAAGLPPQPEPVPPGERKMQFVAPAEIAPEERKDEVPADFKQLAGPIFGFTPSMDCLLNAPSDEAASICGMSEDQVKGFRKAQDRLYLLGQLRQRAEWREGRMLPLEDVIRGTKSYRLFAEQVHRSTELQACIKDTKAMDTADSGAGADWIPTGWSTELFNRVELALRVPSLFRSIPMPQNPYKLPIQGDKATAYKAAESTADSATALTATDAGTASLQLDLVKIAARVLFSDELAEDSILPILPYVEDEIVFALSDGIENCTVNGDTQTTHFDTGYTVAAGDVRRCWEGLRRLQNKQTPTAAAVDLSGTNFSADKLLEIKLEMGKYGVNPREGAWIMSIAAYIKAMALDECLTLDKYGPRAVIHEGELAQLFGSPVVVSEHVAQNLNTAGIYDASTTDNTILLYVHRPSFVFGQGSNKVESDRIVETQQTQVVAAVRLDFEPLYAEATNLMVGLGHEVALTV